MVDVAVAVVCIPAAPKQSSDILGRFPAFLLVVHVDDFFDRVEEGKRNKAALSFLVDGGWCKATVPKADEFWTTIDA